ncbi:CvfB family protein [Alkalitalea saponilacus]|uniref:S1 motif domain-containing protein n=1 Tax=Alkalitalea saponilacus TaxID=889453 RepID=A0A1T5CLZ5_9BACT|nr:S1-like domain-containing RNA-binding protein [Alkalitalea saponilacus]ASB49907.1 GntR family transcriptional regulator [Alkalitalea saponilacus]SKB60361.1 hypothetical protein SAMN03080601_00866 [Alkalitalea saponilacus]
MQVEIGKTNKLKVLRKTSVGLYLDGDTIGDVLLPNRYVPENINEGDEIDVFVYLDSEDRLIATTETPLAMVGDFAFLKVIETGRFGAFMDWGLMKDLLVPFREQHEKMQKDKSYVVYVYLDDETGRIAASSKIFRFLDNISPKYNPGEEVDLLVAEETELGYKAIINSLHSGMIYKNQIFKPIQIGDKTKGYINKVREDDKIDLLLEKPGHDKMDELSKRVLDIINQHNGQIAISDKSSPEEISSVFEMSKKNFKKAIGTLYKNRLIVIEENGIKRAPQ